MKGISLTRSIFGALIFASVSHAQTVTWNRVSPVGSGPGGNSPILFAEGKFVTAGEVIIYSEDNGQTWHEAKGLQPGLRYTALSYGNGRFVASNTGNAMASSDDGVTWEYHDAALGDVANASFYSGSRDVVFGNGQFVAVGGDGKVSASVDGKIWTPKNAGGTLGLAITYGNGKFVILDTPGAMQFPMPHPLMISEDGNNWTRSVIYSHCDFNGCVQGDNFNSLVFEGGQFKIHTTVSIHLNRFDYIIGSTDLTNFNTVASQPTPAMYAALDQADNRSLAFGNGAYVNTLLQSGPDPDHLSDLPSPAKFDFRGVASHGDVVVGVGSSSTGIAVSTNAGGSFQFVANPQSGNGLGGVRYANGRFVAFGNGLAWSQDGFNWSRSIGDVSTNVVDATYANGRWVAVGYGWNGHGGERGMAFTSTDGVNFTERSIGTEIRLFGVASDGSKFVAVGEEGATLTSTDGIGWTLRQLPGNQAFKSIAYGNGVFVATDPAGIAAVSKDGIVWQAVSGPQLLSPRITFANGIFVAGGNGNYLASIDGFHWEASPVVSGGGFGLDSSDGKIWASGPSGGLWRATIGSVGPALIGSVLDSIRFKLNIVLPEAGTYHVRSTPALPSAAWETVATLTNISGQVEWTHTNAIVGARIYQVQKAE